MSIKKSLPIFYIFSLLVLHIGLQAVLLGLVWWLVKTIFATSWTAAGLVVPITYLLFDEL